MLAAAGAPERALTFAVGPVGIRLRIAGEALAERLAPALEPLAAARPHDVDIVAFEGELPSPPWDASAPGEHYAAADGVQVLHGPDTLLLLDGNRGAFWARDAEALPRWETAAPLRTLLRWALREHGLHLVHGAAVVGARGAALLAGRSGAGKSTTALAAAEAGLGLRRRRLLRGRAERPAAGPRALRGRQGRRRRTAPGPGPAGAAGRPTPDGKELVVPRGLTRSAAARIDRAAARGRRGRSSTPGAPRPRR